MHADEERPTLSQCDPVEEKMAKKLFDSKGNLLFIGDMVALVSACLSSITIYMLSLLEALKGFPEEI
jgi:hypothetical protein